MSQNQKRYNLVIEVLKFYQSADIELIAALEMVIKAVRQANAAVEKEKE